MRWTVLSVSFSARARERESFLWPAACWRARGAEEFTLGVSKFRVDPFDARARRRGPAAAPECLIFSAFFPRGWNFSSKGGLLGAFVLYDPSSRLTSRGFARNFVIYFFARHPVARGERSRLLTWWCRANRRWGFKALQRTEVTLWCSWCNFIVLAGKQKIGTSISYLKFNMMENGPSPDALQGDVESPIRTTRLATFCSSHSPRAILNFSYLYRCCAHFLIIRKGETSV